MRMTAVSSLHTDHLLLAIPDANTHTHHAFASRRERDIEAPDAIGDNGSAPSGDAILAKPTPPRNLLRKDWRLLWLWDQYQPALQNYNVCYRRVYALVLEQEYATGERVKGKRVRRSEEEWVAALHVEGAQSSGAFFDYWRSRNQLIKVKRILLEWFDKLAPGLEEASTSVEPSADADPAPSSLSTHELTASPTPVDLPSPSPSAIPLRMKEDTPISDSTQVTAGLEVAPASTARRSARLGKRKSEELEDADASASSTAPKRLRSVKPTPQSSKSKKTSRASGKENVQ